jgi:hypothetical protein
MKPVMTTGGGQCFAFPDTCKTPSPGGPVPIPYPNITMCSDGKGSSKVTVLNKETLRKGDTFRMSSGDEGGTAGGSVISNKIKGKSEVKQGCDSVKVQGKAIAYLLVTVGQNGGSGKSSPAGKNVKPGATKVKLRKVRGKNRKARVKVRKHKRDRKGKTKSTKAKQNKGTKAKSDAAKRARSKQAKIRASEAMGDAGARQMMAQIAKQFGGVVGKIVSFAGKNVVDVMCVTATGVVLVAEAKGGGSPLGFAVVAGVGLCQQGTMQYLEHIANQMIRSKKKNVAEMGRRLKAAIKAKKVRYSETRTRQGKDIVDKQFDP